MPRRHDFDPARDTDGAALVLALLTTVLLASLGIGLVTLADTERMLAAHQLQAADLRYATEAAAEVGLAALQELPWDSVLAGATRSSFVDSTLTPTTPYGESLDVMALTSDLQAASDTVSPLGADRPQWKVFSFGPISNLAVAGRIESPVYVLTWVADDPSDGDGNAALDGNGVVTLLARGLGPDRLVSNLEVTLARPVDGRVRVLSWKETQ